MKTKFTKFISLILALTFLVSAFSMYTFAEADGSGVQPIYNRTYDEGWDYDNGLATTGNSAGGHKTSLNGNKVWIDKEVLSDNNYNYFMRLEATNINKLDLVFDFTSYYVQRESGTVIKMSFKADDMANFTGDSGMATILSASTNLKESLTLLGVSDGVLYAFGDKSGGGATEIAPLTNDWIDIAIVFDWDRSKDVYYTVYYGEDYSESKTVTYAYKTPGDIGLTDLVIGFPTASSDEKAAARDGATLCIDNFQIYQNTKEILSNAEVNAMGPGFRLDTEVPKTIEILSSKSKTTDQILEAALCMKLGVDYALVRDKKVPIFVEEKDGVKTVYGAPEKVDGTVMVPLQFILEYIDCPFYVHPDGMSYDITVGSGKTNLVAGRDSASVNGERVALTVAPGFVNANDNKYLVIALDDIETLFPGWLTTYDDMGLVIVYEDYTPENLDDNGDVVNRDTHLDKMVDLMKKFIFSTVTLDENGNPLRASDSYVATGEAVYNDVKANTNNFTHPYIGAVQASFDKLNETYRAAVGTDGYNATAKKYLSTLVAKADDFYNSVAVSNDGSYVCISPDKVPVNVYKDGIEPDDANPGLVADTVDGYDDKYGRVDEIVGFTSHLVDLAFAYQVTRNTKYVELAYDWAVALGEWEHWGPGYMVDCAEATYNFALAYDWLYNAVKDMYGEEGTTTLAEILYNNGVHDGYIASLGKECEHPRNLGDESIYSTLDTHKNAVGTAGMVAGALALMEYPSLKGVDALTSELQYLVGNNIIGLMNNGLYVYAPDGSYIESPTNWELGTNYLLRLIMSLDTAAGTNYGLVDTWGIDNTCYYAIYIESSDGIIWNYHEVPADGVITGEIGGLDTQMFNFASVLFGDADLAAIRDKQLASGKADKEVSIYDMLYFPFDGIGEVPELSLDYHMDGIDAFISRSDWEAGALYTGIMGGANNANYGQIDSGNFIYHNEGVKWFIDLGSDDFATYQYFGSSRKNYYRVNPEGQNVAFVTSDANNLLYGQRSDGKGTIVKTVVNDHGALAIVDNSDVYRGTVVTANRGMMLTNDRKTVVIQDEINFGIHVQDLVWVAHTAEKIELSEDGRTAYLTSKTENGNTLTLRASLVSNNRALKFSVENADKIFMNTTTYGPSGSSGLGGAPEYSREGIQKLVIKIENAVNFNAAVALEMVGSNKSEEPIGYKWTELSSWVPSEWSGSTGESSEEIREGVVVSNIKTYTNIAKKLFDDETAFTEKLAEFYHALTEVEYTVVYLEYDFDSAYADSYYEYLDLVDEYEAFKDELEVLIDNVFFFADSFAGVNEEAPEVEEEEEEE